MALKSISPVLRRMMLLTALAAVVGACQTSPPAVNKPPVPEASPGESQTPSGEPATAAPTPNTSVASPLPDPSVDSDLAAEDQTALENLLDSEQILAYLPADLINDGGVILYQTLNARQGGVPVQTRQAENDAAAEAGFRRPGEPPGSWKRLEGERGGRQLVMRRQAGAAAAEKRARVVVRYPMRGELAYRDARTGTVVRKRYSQMFERVFIFELRDNRWRLAQLSPVQMESQGGRSGLEINSFEVFVAGQEASVLKLTDRERLIGPDEMPVFAPGQSIRLEAAIANSRPGSFFVFAHLAGKSDRSRQLLVDDGTGGDRVAGDGVFTGSFVVPASEGLRHFGLDVIDATTFQPGGLYRSNTLGMSFRVRAQ